MALIAHRVVLSIETMWQTCARRDDARIRISNSHVIRTHTFAISPQVREFFSQLPAI
jgi:hypothetical protein